MTGIISPGMSKEKIDTTSHFNSFSINQVVLLCVSGIHTDGT